MSLPAKIFNYGIGLNSPEAHSRLSDGFGMSLNIVSRID